MNQRRICLIAVRCGEQERLALEVCVRGSDVYVNYFARDGAKQAHSSYHESGQRHIKTNGGYVEWTGGRGVKWNR